MIRECDMVVIGGGPGGLAAAYAAKKSGADSVVVLERDANAGGILNQCIHDGFGLIRYRKALTGPEYAYRVIGEAEDAGARILTSRHVTGITPDNIVTAYTRDGIEEYRTKAVILATGCRERTRGNISVPGSRPAGVYTAGVAQNLVNCRNVMIGKKVVILGSGDIGLIMARRLTLEGAKVLAVAEILPEPAGLARNVSQCVNEFGIPLYVKTTVSKIIGKRKLEAVEISDVDECMKVIPGTGRTIECDTLVLSVGLIPENEVAEIAGVKLCHNNAVETDVYLQTSVQGIFSCGNSRRVMDLADYVSEQGEMAGRNAVHFMKHEPMEVWDEHKSNCMMKGFPKEGVVTCTMCPNGCQVELDSKTGGYTGNRCPKGSVFAEQERNAPVRTVTTSIKLENLEHKLLPVRSAEPVDKKEVQQVVNLLKGIRAKVPVDVGDDIYSMVLNGKEIRIVATMGISV